MRINCKILQNTYLNTGIARRRFIKREYYYVVDLLLLQVVDTAIVVE